MGLLKTAGIDKYLKKIKKYIDDGLSKKVDDDSIFPMTFSFDLQYMLRNSTASGDSIGTAYVTHEVMQQAGFTNNVMRRLWDSHVPICMAIHNPQSSVFLPIHYWTYAGNFTEEDEEAGYISGEGLAKVSFGYIDLNYQFGLNVDIVWDFDMHLWRVVVSEV